jgi:hypothetical protein
MTKAASLIAENLPGPVVAPAGAPSVLALPVAATVVPGRALAADPLPSGALVTSSPILVISKERAIRAAAR